jgi:uncharacterized protein (TIGR03086 family)
MHTIKDDLIRADFIRADFIRADLIRADAAAVRDTAALVARVTAKDLDRRTPCAGWDLRTLIEHLTSQHRGFAAAAGGRGTDPSAWLPPASTDRSAAALTARHAQAAQEVITAFSAPDVLDRAFALPDFGRTFPGRLAIGFHLVDYVVHGWDVARSLDLPYQPGTGLLAATLPIARAVPDGAERLAPGAAFAPAVAVAAGAGPLAEMLALLGRDPSWRP